MRKKIINSIVSFLVFLSYILLPARGTEAKAAASQKFFSNDDKKSNLLILKHAKELFFKKNDLTNNITWHYSHYSHRSHYSHYSHRSHYSHYSSW